MKKIHTKKGAASFYIVAFSTLILVIIAISFATVILNEVTRTTNADLSQSAYDAALAGVEDAKIAFLKYESCLKDSGSDSNCAAVMEYMENPNCDMVAHALSRYGDEENGEVIIKEIQDSDNQMKQAYTCVVVNTDLSDYRSSLDSANSSHIVGVNLEGVDVNNVTAAELSWYSDNNGTEYNFTNVQDDGKVVFSSTESSISTPPTVAFQLIQTGDNFALSSFNKTQNGQTNRGTVYLVPTNNLAAASNNMENNHFAAYQNAQNTIPSEALLRSNDHGESGTNLPYTVYCDPNSDSEFLCSTIIDLPLPIGGTRSAETFSFIISLPYGTPSTDFAIQLYCGTEKCTKSIELDDEPDEKYNIFRGAQVSIDSTGRANDLYRRVETRLEVSGSSSLYSEYAIQLFGTNEDGEVSLEKDIYTNIKYDL